MGVLASFFKNENLERPAAKAANPANFDAADDLNSQNSRDSQPPASEIEFLAERKFAEFANFAGDELKRNPGGPSLAGRRDSVEAIYAKMEAERERRRDRYAQPVEGWRDGRLIFRNIARDETVVIDFRKWRSGR